MSKVFYDNLVVLEKVEKIINRSSLSQDEREELWRIVDEIVHHRVMGCILEGLPRPHHEEFLDKFSVAPHDGELFSFLEAKGDNKAKERIQNEASKIEEEILKEITKEK